MIRAHETSTLTSRFSNRAENYLLYRPAYPPAVLDFLQEVAGLRHDHSIADIGSGTGRFTKLLLDKGYSVTAVEPNEAMRTTAEKNLSSYTGFRSQAGEAEQTGLTAESIDLITIAHAFHWMDIGDTKAECQRILKPGGQTVLLWMIRQTQTEFLAAYDRLKKQFRSGEAPPLIDEESIRAFFEPATVQSHSIAHNNWVNFDGLKGLLLSSSGIPLPGQPHYDTMISSLVQLFVAFNINGFVNMEYETRIYMAG